MKLIRYLKYSILQFIVVHPIDLNDVNVLETKQADLDIPDAREK